MKRQKIYIESLALVEGHFSGIGQYNLGILKGIDYILEEKKYRGEETPVVKALIPKDSVPKFLSYGFKHIGYKKFPLSFRYTAALWHRQWLPPIDLWFGKASYIFTRFVDMPLLFNKSSGLVVFDLTFELFKQYAEERNAYFLSKFTRNSIENTKKVIAISENSKKELTKFYGLASDKVALATPATDFSVFYRRDKSEIERVKQKYGIEGEYILSLSNLEPRKNLNMLIEAYCSLPNDKRTNLSLLLVGVNGWKTDELFKDIISRVEEGFNIIRPSEYISDVDKPAIISGAKFLVYPSHYEGFGMPPLEALACGTPVICSNNSSLPEVVGKVGDLVPSNDKDALLSMMINYIDHIEEISKKVLTEGPYQASKFSWVKSAQVFLSVVMDK